VVIANNIAFDTNGCRLLAASRMVLKWSRVTGELAGIGYVGSTGEDAEKMCADENGLFKNDGKWYSK